MTLEYPTTRLNSNQISHRNNQMGTSVRHEWPMGCYLEAWKLFRDVSNENEETADQLVTMSKWPTNDNYQILDIGSGDGLLLKRIVTQSPTRVGHVRLLDPDKELMDQAVSNLEERLASYQISFYLSKIEDRIPTSLQDVDVILAVHIVYLLPPESFKNLLTELPFKIPFYVVLDNENSIFSRLWKKTAPKYYERAIAAHQLIKQLPRDRFKVVRTSVTSLLTNPLSYPRKRIDLKNLILSILCYTDVRDRPQQELHYIENEIQKSVSPANNRLRCASDCYEIVRIR